MTKDSRGMKKGLLDGIHIDRIIDFVTYFEAKAILKENERVIAQIVKFKAQQKIEAIEQELAMELRNLMRRRETFEIQMYNRLSHEDKVEVDKIEVIR